MAATTAARRPRLAGWLAAAGWFIFTRERRAGRAATQGYPQATGTRRALHAQTCLKKGLRQIRLGRCTSIRAFPAPTCPRSSSTCPSTRRSEDRVDGHAVCRAREGPIRTVLRPHAMEATLQSCGPVAACGLQTAAGVLAPFENWRGLSGAGGAGRCGAPLAGGRATWCPVRRLG